MNGSKDENKRQQQNKMKTRKQLAKCLGVKESELDDLARVTVTNDDGSEDDVNVQACLENLKQNESN